MDTLLAIPMSISRLDLYCYQTLNGLKQLSR